MLQIKIPITKLPIFHDYLYDFIKNDGKYEVDFDFIANNFFIKGYCTCRQKGCCTVHLESTLPINKCKITKSNIIINTEIIQRLHLDDNSIVKEFEYLDKKYMNEPIFKDEVFNAVDMETKIYFPKI